MGEKSIGYQRMVDIHEAVSHLEALARIFRDGRIVVTHGGKRLDREPRSVVVLEIEVKQKKDNTRFAFEIACKNDAGQAGGEYLEIAFGTGESPPAG